VPEERKGRERGWRKCGLPPENGGKKREKQKKGGGGKELSGMVRKVSSILLHLSPAP